MDNRIKGFILRGLAAGAAGGIAAALFLRFVTETQITAALRFEDATGVGLPPGDPARFSRGTQHWGGMAATVIYGSLLGIVLGVVVAALHHRLRGRNEFERGAKVAASAFVALVLIPALKYPPNPPTVGEPDTIGQRSTQFLLLMAASVVVVAAGWYLWGQLTERGWRGAPRFLAGGGGFVVMVTVLMLVWPASPDPVSPPDSDAAPALEVSASAPPEVLAAMLDTARETGDRWLRDPAAPDEPLNLDTVSPEDLVGVPAAVSTTHLVADTYTTIIWHFRLLSLAGLALLWAVMAGIYGLLADHGAGWPRRRSGPTGPPDEVREDVLSS
jgi:hypothetical protein